MTQSATTGAERKVSQPLSKLPLAGSSWQPLAFFSKELLGPGQLLFHLGQRATCCLQRPSTILLLVVEVLFLPIDRSQAASHHPVPHYAPLVWPPAEAAFHHCGVHLRHLAHSRTEKCGRGPSFHHVCGHLYRSCPANLGPPYSLPSPPSLRIGPMRVRLPHRWRTPWRLQPFTT